MRKTYITYAYKSEFKTEGNYLQTISFVKTLQLEYPAQGSHILLIFFDLNLRHVAGTQTNLLMTYTCNRGLKNPEYGSTQQDLPDKKIGEDSGMQGKSVKVRH